MVETILSATIDELFQERARIKISKEYSSSGGFIQTTAELSGHSFRVGAAIDLLEAGQSLEKIMVRGGWQSEATAIRYLRGWRGADVQ